MLKFILWQSDVKNDTMLKLILWQSDVKIYIMADFITDHKFGT